jgi:hydroxyacyl-ACP dehydratase HTD2-like protein with hotdog domain
MGGKKMEFVTLKEAINQVERILVNEFQAIALLSPLAESPRTRTSPAL